jgi:hypothetical protein
MALSVHLVDEHQQGRGRRFERSAHLGDELIVEPVVDPATGDGA